MKKEKTTKQSIKDLTGSECMFKDWVKIKRKDLLKRLRVNKQKRNRLLTDRINKKTRA